MQFDAFHILGLMLEAWMWAIGVSVVGALLATLFFYPYDDDR